MPQRVRKTIAAQKTTLEAKMSFVVITQKNPVDSNNTTDACLHPHSPLPIPLDHPHRSSCSIVLGELASSASTLPKMGKLLYTLSLSITAKGGLSRVDQIQPPWASPCLPLQWAEFFQALDGRVLSFGDGDGSFGFRKTAASSLKWNEVLMPFIVMLLGGVTHNNNQMNGELQNVTTSNRMLILPPVIDWMLASISIRQRWWEILWWDYS